MTPLKLVIANKNISSWSMRPWVLLSEAGIPFEEELVPFGAPEWRARVGSPSGRVPMLIDGEAREPSGGGLRIWDSLAICEYLADKFPEKQLWPAAADARAVARAVSAEMHSGFPDLRRECSMNLVLRVEKELSPAATADVRRVDALFADCRGRFGAGGEMLFGKLSAADAMFAPVAGRVRTYGLKLSPVSQKYVEALLALPSVRRWDEQAKAEVAAGIVDPVSHGALFSRGEAERLARRWLDGWNANQPEARAALCSELVRARGLVVAQGRGELQKAWRESAHASASGRGGSFDLEGFGWDGDANSLTIRCARGGERRVEVLGFDSTGLVASIDSYGA